MLIYIYFLSSFTLVFPNVLTVYIEHALFGNYLTSEIGNSGVEVSNYCIITLACFISFVY